MIVSGQEVVTWVANMIEAPVPLQAQSLGWVRDDEIIAGVLYESYTGASIAASIAVAPGAVFPKELLWMMFDYPFEQLKVKKVLTYSRDSNHKVQVMLDKLGFVREAVIPDVYDDGALVIATMTKEQCKWLGDDHARQED